MSPDFFLLEMTQNCIKTFKTVSLNGKTANASSLYKNCRESWLNIFSRIFSVRLTDKQLHTHFPAAITSLPWTQHFQCIPTELLHLPQAWELVQKQTVQAVEVTCPTISPGSEEQTTHAHTLRKSPWTITFFLSEMSTSSTFNILPECLRKIKHKLKSQFFS